jgi:hypothetical protein
MSSLMTGKNAVKYDVNWSINNCKAVIQAIEYMQDTTVSGILVDQATRVGEMFDKMEDLIPIKLEDGQYNAEAYSPMRMGDRWRQWIYQRHTYANNRGAEFLDKWVMFLDDKHTAEDSDGDTTMGGAETEGNDKIVQRVQKLKEAKDALPVWNNPFPAQWGQIVV